MGTFAFASAEEKIKMDQSIGPKSNMSGGLKDFLSFALAIFEATFLLGEWIRV